MKSRETLIRLKKFQVDEKRRKVAQIEAMIAEFDRIAGRARPRDQDRAGPRRHPRSRPFRLSDLCQGRDRPAREPQALGRRAQGPARRRQGGAGRGLRGTEEGRDARRARPRAREGRGRTRASRPNSTASPRCASLPAARRRKLPLFAHFQGGLTSPAVLRARFSLSRKGYTSGVAFLRSGGDYACPCLRPCRADCPCAGRFRAGSAVPRRRSGRPCRRPATPPPQSRRASSAGASRRPRSTSSASSAAIGSTPTAGCSISA